MNLSSFDTTDKHASKVHRYMCFICEESFDSLSDLATHTAENSVQSAYSLPKRKTYHCDHCSSVFLVRSQCIVHVESCERNTLCKVLEKSSNVYKCNLCKNEFYLSREKLCVHFKIKHQIQIGKNFGACRVSTDISSNPEVEPSATDTGNKGENNEVTLHIPEVEPSATYTGNKGENNEVTLHIPDVGLSATETGNKGENNEVTLHIPDVGLSATDTGNKGENNEVTLHIPDVGLSATETGNNYKNTKEVFLHIPELEDGTILDVDIIDLEQSSLVDPIVVQVKKNAFVDSFVDKVEENSFVGLICQVEENEFDTSVENSCDVDIVEHCIDVNSEEQDIEGDQFEDKSPLCNLMECDDVTSDTQTNDIDISPCDISKVKPEKLHGELICNNQVDTDDDPEFTEVKFEHKVKETSNNLQMIDPLKFEFPSIELKTEDFRETTLSDNSLTTAPNLDLSTESYSNLSDKENDLVKKYNLKQLSINITRLNHKVVDTFIIREKGTNLQELQITSQPCTTNKNNAESDTAGKTLKNTSSNNVLVEKYHLKSLSVGITRLSQSIIDSLRMRKDSCDENISIEQEIETQIGPTNVDSLAGLQIKTEIEDSSLIESMDQNEFTSELIIKDEESEDFQDNANIIDEIALEENTSTLDIPAKNVKFCAHCDFETHSKGKLRHHIQDHIKSESALACHSDAKSQSTMGHLGDAKSDGAMGPQGDTRLQNVTAEPQMYPCKLCTCVFPSTSLRTSHLNKHKELLVNNMLDVMFLRNNINPKKVPKVIEKPLVIIQPSIEKRPKKIRSNLNTRFECSECNKSFVRRRTLSLHIKYFHQQIGSFECSVCFKRFNFKTGLTTHCYRMHSNLKPHKCVLCSKRFKTESEKKIHYDQVHSEARPFSCKQCSKTFKTKCAVSKHMEVHNDFNFKCGKCDQMFKSKRMMGRHLKRHKNLRTLQCAMCNKIFRGKKVLTEHIRRCMTKIKQVDI